MSALKEKGAPNDGGLSKTINTKNKEKFEKLKTDSSVTKLYQLWADEATRTVRNTRLLSL